MLGIKTHFIYQPTFIEKKNYFISRLDTSGKYKIIKVNNCNIILYPKSIFLIFMFVTVHHQTHHPYGLHL